jgi:hypothetical protein
LALTACVGIAPQTPARPINKAPAAATSGTPFPVGFTITSPKFCESAGAGAAAQQCATDLVIHGKVQSGCTPDATQCVYLATDWSASSVTGIYQDAMGNYHTCSTTPDNGPGSPFIQITLTNTGLGGLGGILAGTGGASCEFELAFLTDSSDIYDMYTVQPTQPWVPGETTSAWPEYSYPYDLHGIYQPMNGTLTIHWQNDYAIDLRAWIPFDRVVDPYEPAPFGYEASLAYDLSGLDPNCFVPSPPDVLLAYIDSTFAGDNHNDFSTPSWRIRNTAEFLWDDNDQIASVMTPGAFFGSYPHVGKTTLTKLYYNGSNVHIGGPCGRSATLTTPSLLAQQTGPNTFLVQLAGTNPMVAVAPPIRARVEGTVQSNGDVTIDWTGGGFPSLGVEVTIDGITAMTYTFNDASCVPAHLGLPGEKVLGLGLALLHEGEFTVSHNDSGKTASIPSPRC